MSVQSLNLCKERHTVGSEKTCIRRPSIVLYLRPVFHSVAAEWIHAEGRRRRRKRWRRRRSVEVNEIAMRCQGVLTLRDEKSGLKGGRRSGWIVGTQTGKWTQSH